MSKMFVGKPFKPEKTHPEWVKGIFVDGQYKQVKNRNAFSALASVMGGMSLEQAEKMGLLVGHPFRPPKKK